MKPRLITGMSLMTAAGMSLEENYQSLVEKRSGIKRVERFELPVTKVRTNFAGLLPDVPPELIPSDVLVKLSTDDLRQDYVKAAVAARMPSRALGLRAPSGVCLRLKTNSAAPAAVTRRSSSAAGKSKKPNACSGARAFRPCTRRT